MIILNEENDKKLFHKMIEIIENSDKKILLAYKHEQDEIGAMYRLPSTNKPYYNVNFSTINGLYEIINDAIEEKFDILLVYHNGIKSDNFKDIEEHENGIEIIIANVYNFTKIE